MIQIENLTKSYWAKKIFNNLFISWFDKFDKIWIIWENWVWKSTLLKLIYWLEKPDLWNIKFDLKEPLIGYMSQELEINLKECTILEYLKENSWYNEIEQKINEIYNNYNENLTKELWILQGQFEKLWWYDFERIVDVILEKLFGKNSVMANNHLPLLSWWQKSKILLTEALLKWWDILLLDEPTNNLDIEAINWLINFLENSQTFVLIVSHDKYFLNQVTNKTIEIKNWNVAIFSWNYDFYELQKNLETNRNNEAYEEYAEKFKELNQKLSQEYGKKSSLQKAKVGPDTDSRRKFQQNYAQNHSWWNIRKYKKELENLVKNKPEIEKKKPLIFDLSINKKVFWWIFIYDLEFKYENSSNWVECKKFEIQNWEKVLVVWNNASWKTTFLKLLNWELKPQKWKIKISPNIKIWNYSQEKKYLDETKLTLIEFLNFSGNNNKNWEQEDIHNILKKFNFTQEEKNLPIYLLSPWQKSRLLLALFSLVKYNTIFLDEPTNHLDLEAVDELEKALHNFNWNLIVVSHDKWFIDKINFDKKYEMRNGKLIEFL